MLIKLYNGMYVHMYIANCYLKYFYYMVDGTMNITITVYLNTHLKISSYDQCHSPS